MGSVIWSPIRRTGFSDVIGSWKTIDSCGPHRCSLSSGRIDRMSSPRQRIRDSAGTVATGGSRSMMVRTRTDFPDPDSPTTPRHSPLRKLNVTPSTARTSPRAVAKVVRRSSICSSGGAGVPLLPRDGVAFAFTALIVLDDSLISSSPGGPSGVGSNRPPG